MFLAATYLSSGSELLLEILGPGIVGGLFLPMLGALPDAMLILGTEFDIVYFFYQGKYGNAKITVRLMRKWRKTTEQSISFFKKTK